MGFLWFGDNKQKNIQANETSKKNLINALASASATCSNAQVCVALNDLKNQLQSQGQSDSKDMAVIDVKLKAAIQEINVAIGKGQFASASRKLGEAKRLVADRQGLCQVGGQKTKQQMREDKAAEKQQKKMLGKNAVAVEKSHLDELLDRQTRAQDELNDLQAQYEALKKAHEKNPHDRSIATQATVVATNAKLKQDEMNRLNAEIARETSTVGMQQAVNDAQTLADGRTVSNTEAQANIEKLQGLNADTAETMDLIKQTNAAVASGMNTFSDPFAQGNDPFASDPFANDPFAESNTQTQAAPASEQQTQYGNFNAGNVGTREMGIEIAKTASELQKGIDAFNDKIDDASDELRALDREILPLIQRRKSASASECLTLDGQIDQIQARRNIQQIAIKRYRNGAAKLTEQLSLIQQLNIQQGLSETNARINDITNGKFSDLAGLSMYIADSIQKSNEELNNVGELNIAANSMNDVQTNTLSGADAVSVNAVAKDEHRYDALEEEITSSNRKAQTN